MSAISKASAYANNEVGFIAWKCSQKIKDCLGFEITRQYLDDVGNIKEEVPLAAYVAFEKQSNPDWTAQNTSVWPVQKYSWRDLTLRKKRDGSGRRVSEVKVQYRIRPLVIETVVLEKVIPREEKSYNPVTKQYDLANTYEGKPIPLSYLDEGIITNPILITRMHPPFESTFNNGMLSGQWLARALLQDSTTSLEKHLKAPGDAKRDYLSGDVIELMREFFKQPNGRFYMALYELDDIELEELIHLNVSRISLILSNTGLGADSDSDAKVWDDRNAPARQKLIDLAKQNKNFKLQHRMFNNSVQIGHNKFVVWVDDNNVPQTVLTGSTNWTWSGLTAQSNNCIRINDNKIAEQYFQQWNQLESDTQLLPLPDPLNAAMPANKQGEQLRAKNSSSATISLPQNANAEIWFSPNMRPRKYPKNPDTPPDLDRVFALMRQAKKAIFFLAFYPSMQGKNSIIEQAVNLGVNDKSLLVIGAVSAQEAMFNFSPEQKSGKVITKPKDAPFIYKRNQVSVVRAAAITDKILLKPLGDFKAEKLKAGNAIIHDKILIVDPLDPVNCMVVFGSHNEGFKASYSNDENMVIVRGHQALALSYAVHVLDVYDHYKFRAVQSQLQAEGKSQWNGFLTLKDDWQDDASTDISDYFAV